MCESAGLKYLLRGVSIIMKIYIYKGGLSLVAKSGVGSAIRHQEKMLRAVGADVTEGWKEADIVQTNTVLPDALLAARR